jgi:hypothetical protein
MSEEIPPPGETPSPSWRFKALLRLYPHTDKNPLRAYHTTEEMRILLLPPEKQHEWALGIMPIEMQWEPGVCYLTGENVTEENRFPRIEKRFLKRLEAAKINDITTPVWREGYSFGILVTRRLSDWREKGFNREELKILKEKLGPLEISS